MEQTEIKQAIENIIDNSEVGVMATIHKDQPHARYMTFVREGLNLYTATSKETHKVEDIEANPNTHILIGYDGKGFGDEYLAYEGKVIIKDSESQKKELWNPSFENYFDGPQDPNYIVLEVLPSKILLMNKKGKAPKTLEI